MDEVKTCNRCACVDFDWELGKGLISQYCWYNFRDREHYRLDNYSWIVSILVAYIIGYMSQDPSRKESSSSGSSRSSSSAASDSDLDSDAVEDVGDANSDDDDDYEGSSTHKRSDTSTRGQGMLDDEGGDDNFI